MKNKTQIIEIFIEFMDTVCTPEKYQIEVHIFGGTFRAHRTRRNTVYGDNVLRGSILDKQPAVEMLSKFLEESDKAMIVSDEANSIIIVRM